MYNFVVEQPLNRPKSNVQTITTVRWINRSTRPTYKVKVNSILCNHQRITHIPSRNNIKIHATRHLKSINVKTNTKKIFQFHYSIESSWVMSSFTWHIVQKKMVLMLKSDKIMKSHFLSPMCGINNSFWTKHPYEKINQFENWYCATKCIQLFLTGFLIYADLMFGCENELLGSFVP